MKQHHDIIDEFRNNDPEYDNMVPWDQLERDDEGLIIWDPLEEEN